MPRGAVYVGRPTKWGNPFVGPGAVSAYRDWITTGWRLRMGVASDGQKADCVKLDTPKAGELQAMLHELRGKNLVCWCPPGKACHADVLLELANKSS